MKRVTFEANEEILKMLQKIARAYAMPTMSMAIRFAIIEYFKKINLPV